MKAILWIDKIMEKESKPITFTNIELETEWIGKLLAERTADVEQERVDALPIG